MSAEHGGGHGAHGGPGGIKVVDALINDLEPLGDVVESLITVLFLGMLNAPGRRVTAHGGGHHG